jgi:hypothetical protein
VGHDFEDVSGDAEGARPSDGRSLGLTRPMRHCQARISHSGALVLHSHRRSTAHRPAPHSAASPPSLRKIALIFSICKRRSRTGSIVLPIFTNLRALWSLMVVRECALSLPQN